MNGDKSNAADVSLSIDIPLRSHDPTADATEMVAVPVSVVAILSMMDPASVGTGPTATQSGQNPVKLSIGVDTDGALDALPSAQRGWLLSS